MVVFQNDIRRALIRLGAKAWLTRGHAAQERIIEEVVKAATELARHRMGAIMCFERDANIFEFIKNDGFYTSIFIANLGSLGMNAGYHHLYEYGTCPLFMMVGKIDERAVVVDGKVVPRKILPVRWTYDERIDDGLTSKYGMQSCRQALENPEEAFGPIE